MCDIGELPMSVCKPVIGFVLLAFSYACAHQRDAGAIDASICVVAAAPQQYANRTIRTRAAVLSDGIEYIVLVDEHCPGTGVVPVFSATDVASGGAALSAAIYTGRPGTTDKKITATFIGVLHWNKAAAAPHLTIELRGVTGMEVTPIN